MKKLRVNRFLPTSWQEITLTKEEAHHIIIVQRAKLDEKVLLIDLASKQFVAQIIAIKADSSMFRLVEQVEADMEPPYRIHFVQGVPKGEKWEVILQKGVEMGATDFYPIIMQRSVVRWQSKDWQKKLPRWEKIIAAAALQSRRGSIPTLHAEQKWLDLLKKLSCLNNVLLLVLWEDEHGQTLKNVLQQNNLTDIEHIVFVIGPEGGITVDEITTLRRFGFQSVSLGGRILRTETAGLAVLANLAYQFEL